MDDVSSTATLRRLIDEKKREIARLESELSAARQYIETIETYTASAADGSRESHSDDAALEVRALILRAGQPLYIDEILRGLDLPLNRKSREHIREILLPLVCRSEVFTGPRPSTFGLVELERRRDDSNAAHHLDRPDPPSS